MDSERGSGNNSYGYNTGAESEGNSTPLSGEDQGAVIFDSDGVSF